MNKKYEFTGETMRYFGRDLRRIRALVDIGSVQKGAVGGWVASEANLSHDGGCWVGGMAIVMDSACVRDDAIVEGTSVVSDYATIFDQAVVTGCSRVGGASKIYGNAHVTDNSRVFGRAMVSGQAYVHAHAYLFDDANAFGQADVGGTSQISGNAKIHGAAKVCDSVRVLGSAEVCGHAIVHDSVEIMGTAKVQGTACIRGNSLLKDGVLQSITDYMCVGPIGSRCKFTTLNLVTGTVCTGCFQGTLDDFERAVNEEHGDNEHGTAYKNLIAYFRTLNRNLKYNN